MAVNPYDSNNPVSPDDFAGRKELITRIKDYIVTSIAERPQNVAIVGGWGTGKTSIIDLVNPFAQAQNCLVVDIDVSETETSRFVDLYKKLLNSIRICGIEMAVKKKNKNLLKICEDIGYTIKAGVDFTKDSYPTAVFQLKLKELWEELSNHVSLIIIILDNAEHLNKIKGILLELRNIFQRLNRQNTKYLLIISTKSNLFSDVKQTVEPTSRFFHYLPLENFNLEEAREAIVKPLNNRKINFQYTEEAIEFIQNKSQGHPYFIKLLCHHFFDLAKKNKAINIAFINNNYKELMKRLIDDKLGRDFERLPDSEKEVLVSACTVDNVFSNKDLEKVVNVGNVNDALKRLVEKESGELIIKQSRGKYSIYHPLFKEFLIWLSLESEKSDRISKYIPSGRIIKGENAIEQLFENELKSYVKICDEWFNYKSVELLEIIPSSIFIQVLSSKLGDNNQKNQLKRKLDKLCQRKNIEIEFRYMSEFPFHIRYIITENKGWQLSHSLKDLGQKASYISAIVTDLNKLETDFDKYWNNAEKIFPSATIYNKDA